jgi:hypothetical protein
MVARLAVLGGVAAFIAGAYSRHAQAAWTALLANYLYWVALAQAGVVWAATLDLARARWSGPVRRLGEACVGFLPLSFVVLVALYLGRTWILPWIGRDTGDLGAWLNVPGVFLRNGVGLAVLTVLSLLYVRRRNRSFEVTTEPPARPSSVLAALIPLVYAIVYSVLAFDLIMGVAFPWHSTLIGAYYFVGGMLTAMAFLALAGAARLSPQQRLDVGNLLLAFVMLTAYLFFAHLIAIWYANLPKETSFLLVRYQPPWYTLAWAVILGAFLVPFACLAVRETKQNPRLLAGVALLVLVAMWLERYLLVAPSLAPAGRWPGVLEVFITLGFAGAFLLTFEAAVRHDPRQ